MRLFNKIVLSKKAPTNKSDIWYDGSVFKIFDDDDWWAITVDVEAATQVNKVIENALNVFQAKLTPGRGISIKDNIISLDADPVEGSEIFQKLSIHVDEIDKELPTYKMSMTEELGSGEILKSYIFKQGDTEIGRVSLPRDLVVASGSVVKHEGVLCLELVLTSGDILHIPVTALADIYSGSEFVYVSEDNKISIDRDAIVAGLAPVSLVNEKIEMEVARSDNKYATKAELEELTVEGSYTSAISDKNTEMPSQIGGLNKGTKVSDLEGKTINEMFDSILFPTIYPTFTNPSASLSLYNYSSIQEVGAAGPQLANLNRSFSRGSIMLNGEHVSPRAGEIDEYSSFIYVDGDTSIRDIPSIVNLTPIKFKYRAYYSAGPQPKDSKGNDYGNPLSAGYVDSNEVSIAGTYPWYASTSSATVATSVVKQSLVAWNTTEGNMSTGNFTLQPSGTLPQVFKLPRKMTSIQMLNTISGKMESTNISDYTETTETININGNSRTYYVYTYNGAARGSVTLLVKF